jgi:CHAT domain-containing protein
VDLPDGPLSAREILRLAPRLARLVVLSACERAAIGDTRPDEAISPPVALLEWGAVGVIGTLWRVTDESTAILMWTFYDLWRGSGLSIPHALVAAQRALRTVINAELLASYPALFTKRAAQVPAAHRHPWESARRYNDPYYWAPFLILGR